MDISVKWFATADQIECRVGCEKRDQFLCCWNTTVIWKQTVYVIDCCVTLSTNLSLLYGNEVVAFDWRIYGTKVLIWRPFFGSCHMSWQHTMFISCRPEFDMKTGKFVSSTAFQTRSADCCHPKIWLGVDGIKDMSNCVVVVVGLSVQWCRNSKLEYSPVTAAARYHYGRNDTNAQVESFCFVWIVVRRWLGYMIYDKQVPKCYNGMVVLVVVVRISCTDAANHIFFSFGWEHPLRHSDKIGFYQGYVRVTLCTALNLSDRYVNNNLKRPKQKIIYW